jgi:anti-sigma regulatory factor (Ser/Thr protein kinase)
MTDKPHRLYPISDRSYIAALRRDVRLLAIEIGLPATKISEIDIILAELTSNLVKYAQGGEILVRPVLGVTNVGVELISIDTGPGMENAEQMLADGVSTSGSLGHGLGAIQRLADLFQLYSVPKQGTIILVRVFNKPASLVPADKLATVYSLLVPKLNETVSGDGFFCRLTTSSLKVFLGDGLGHGVKAHQAIEQATNVMEEQRESSPAAWLTAINKATTGTRGLVGTGANFDFMTRKWTLCGVGNIRTQFMGGHQTKSYAGHNGILGYAMPIKLLEHEFNYEPGQYLIMTSDGIQSRWRPARYAKINRYDPAILAVLIYKEYARLTDDVSVAVARIH